MLTRAGSGTDDRDRSRRAHSDGEGFQVGMTAPEKVIIRVYDARGTLVHDAEHDIRWTHTEGRCGGPSTAERVVL